MDTTGDAATLFVHGQSLLEATTGIAGLAEVLSGLRPLYT